MKTIALAATFDTKGAECNYVKKILESLGVNVFTINMGVFSCTTSTDVTNADIAAAVGQSIEDIASKKDRALATEVLSRGMQVLIPALYAEGKFDAILSFGGSGGTSLVAPAMRQLPIGVPKVIISTMASGNTEQYVGTSDLVLFPSVVDVAGINSISETIFQNAAAAIVGMVQAKDKLPKNKDSNKPLVAATMFGVTTPCITTAKEYLESQGYEVLVFHATGTGGKAMEDLINAGFIQGVLDLTTTEWCDEIVGGVLAAGPHRSEAASLKQVPQVVSVGAMDMVNFGPFDTIPSKFVGRNFYKHNPTVTLMRTTIEENIAIGTKLAEKLNLATGKTALMLPLKGVSAIDTVGAPFHGEQEDQALFDTLKNNVNTAVVEIIELNNNINDNDFALAAAQKLIQLMQK